MKKFALLFAVVCLALGVSFGQASDAMKTSDRVTPSVARYHAHNPFWHLAHLKFGKQRTHETAMAANEGLTIGPNIVCKTARHADGTVFYNECSHNLKTTVGLDAMIAQVGTTGSQPAAFTYLALSADSGAPAIGDTTLASEIATSGLSRHVATYAHTGGTATWTETYTWTASGTVANIQKVGLFNASSSGTLGFENSFSPVSLNSGDQLQVTWTVTAS